MLLHEQPVGTTDGMEIAETKVACWVATVTIAIEFEASSAMWYNDFDVSGFVAY